MKTSSANSFAKPLRLALTGAVLFTGLASAAEPASDPQALARELLNPTRTAPPISVGADHGCTKRREPERKGAAEAVACAGDYGDLAVKAEQILEHDAMGRQPLIISVFMPRQPHGRQHGRAGMGASNGRVKVADG